MGFFCVWEEEDEGGKGVNLYLLDCYANLLRSLASLAGDNLFIKKVNKGPC
jgi:hypothetical protein